MYTRVSPSIHFVFIFACVSVYLKKIDILNYSDTHNSDDCDPRVKVSLVVLIPVRDTSAVI